MFRRLSQTLVAGLLGVSLLAGSALSAPALAPILAFVARPSGSCDWVAESLNGPFSLTVHVDEAVDFQNATPFYLASTLTWTFAGQLPPLDVVDAPGGQRQQRSWGMPGSYPVACWSGAGGGYTITVNVIPETRVKVKAVFTADNGYRLGVGSALGISDATAPVWNDVASEIFGCADGAEAYVLDAPLHGFVYAVAWSDKSVSQGLLGQLRRPGGWYQFFDGKPVYTGDEDWQVFATGINTLSQAGPDLESINAQIALANQGQGDPLTSSTGWVGVDQFLCGQYYEGAGTIVVGEANNTDTPTGSCSNAFPQTCKINKRAHWMWYLRADSSCAFTPGADQDEYLIFRYPVSLLPEPYSYTIFGAAGPISSGTLSGPPASIQ